MKNNFIKKRLLSIAAPFVALLVVGAHTPVAAAPFDSPVGDWDFYFDGSQKGVAQLTFDSDFTVNGLFINMPGKKAKVFVSDALGGRGGRLDSEDPRGAGGRTNSYYLHYGAADIIGTWGYDLKGKIIGSAVLISTNATNGFSFGGPVTEGRRITLSTTRFDTGAKSVFRGVPRVVQPDLSGRYFASGKSTFMFGSVGQTHTEMLDLTPTAFPNYYSVVQYGPGYVGGGFAILSSNNRLGIYTEHYTPGTTNLDIVSISGTFNSANLRGNLSGYDGTNWLTLKIGQIPD